MFLIVPSNNFTHFVCRTSSRLATSFHLIHPIIILLLTACEPPSLVNSDPMYLKDVTVGSSASIIFTVVSVSFVVLGKYFVFVLLIFSPCLSDTTLHVSRSSSTSSRVIAHSTRSSANIIAQGGSFSMLSVRTSTIVMNKRGLRANYWCNPPSIGKYSVSPFCVTTVEPRLTVTSLVRSPHQYGHPCRVPNCVPQFNE